MASLLIVTELEAVPPALVAVHVRVVPAVSELVVDGLQPEVEVIVDSESVTVQVTVTSPMYHPLLPSVPVTTWAITGGVVSGGVRTWSVNVAGLTL